MDSNRNRKTENSIHYFFLIYKGWGYVLLHLEKETKTTIKITIMVISQIKQ
jgi:hypothetical protein